MENDNEPRKQWYGTIEEEYPRQRDGVLTRKRTFTLPVELIAQLETFCVYPKQAPNVVVEQALKAYLQRQERAAAKKGPSTEG